MVDKRGAGPPGPQYQNRLFQNTAVLGSGQS
jgi:hypothetical protein